MGLKSRSPSQKLIALPCDPPQALWVRLDDSAVQQLAYSSSGAVRASKFVRGFTPNFLKRVNCSPTSQASSRRRRHHSAPCLLCGAQGGQKGFAAKATSGRAASATSTAASSAAPSVITSVTTSDRRPATCPLRWYAKIAVLVQKDMCGAP
jgi:hypothetical protein